MTRRAVWTIGAGQCVGWGVLYYAFGVLVVPVERDLGVARWIVTGAFSAALLVSAAAAPTIGKLTDRGRGPAVMRAGGLVAAGLLVAWAARPTVWFSYVAWSGLGLCMAAVLYEPVFAIVGRAIDDAGNRLRAIATITVFGGLASTIFLPVTAWLVEGVGWQRAVYVLAAILALVSVAVHQSVFADPMFGARNATPSTGPVASAHDTRLAGLIATFACSSFAGSALATNLVPALMERRLSPTTAAMFAGLFGVMQLPGRLLIMNGRFQLGPSQMIWSSLGLQVAGLSILVAGASPVSVAAGVTLFACGSGLATLARPYLVLVLYGADRAGRLNGVIARWQQLARAGGPVAAAALAASIGYGVVFGLLSGLLITVGLLVRSQPSAGITNA
ncbi:MAG: MFS transporter [Vicinamibacterales bacterium]